MPLFRDHDSRILKVHLQVDDKTAFIWEKSYDVTDLSSFYSPLG